MTDNLEKMYRDRVRYRMLTDMREFVRLSQSELDHYQHFLNGAERHRLKRAIHHAERLAEIIESNS